MERKSPSESKHASFKTRMLGLTALAASSLACSLPAQVAAGASLDPVAALCGGVGTFLVELELGAGKLIGYGLNRAETLPIGCLSLAVCAVPPVIVAGVAAETPWVGYVALAIPVFAAISFMRGNS